MLLKVFSSETQSWMYYELPKAFKVGYMWATQESVDVVDSLNGQELAWMLRHNPKGENEGGIALSGFDVLFTTQEELQRYKDRYKEDQASGVSCRFVSWFDDGQLEGVGIFGNGYIVNDNGKTIEKV